MKKFALACALSTAALLLSAPVGMAAGTLVSPAANATVTTYHPTFTWTVPEGESVDSFRMARNTHMDDGVLDQTFSYAEVTGTTSYTHKGSILTPGTYYWQVTGRDAAGNNTGSVVQKLVVPPIIVFGKITPKWAPRFDNGRPVDYFDSSIRCNLDKRPTIQLKVYQGKKTIYTNSFSAGWCVDMKPYRFSNTYQKPIKMRKGTRLTMQWFVKTDKSVIKSVVTPFRVH